MSARVGHVSFNMMFGRKDAPLFEKPFSDTLAETIDEEVKALIDQVRERAFDLLNKERDKLEALAGLLLEQEVLGPADLVKVLGERPHGKYVSLNGTPSAPAADGQEQAADERELSDEARTNGHASAAEPSELV